MTWLHIVCSTKLRLMQHEGEGMRLSTQRQGIGLLSQIEQDVLDEGKSLGAALRRCMLLEILHRYAAWHVLRRLRHRIRSTHATRNQADVARRNIAAVVTFLNWLAARDPPSPTAFSTSCRKPSLCITSGKCWSALASFRHATSTWSAWRRGWSICCGTSPPVMPGWSGPSRTGPCSAAPAGPYGISSSGHAPAT